MKRIAVYYRVSTKKQDHEIQEVAFREWYQQPGNGGRVYIYRDTVSGNAKRRPNFDLMMDLVRARKIDQVVVYSIDRFSRNRAAGLETVLELARLEVAFTSITQAFLCTDPKVVAMPFQNVLLAAFTEIAAIERETIVKRVKAGMAVAKAKGKKLGKPTKLTRAMHSDILRMRSSGDGVRAIAEHFGVGHSLIQRALSNDIDSQINYAV